MEDGARDLDVLDQCIQSSTSFTAARDNSNVGHHNLT